MFILLIAFCLGAILGSFGNVLIYRIPKDKSIVSPRSCCPKCQTGISWYDNIPIFSWLILRGRCRVCGSAIPVRYLMVEIFIGFLFALTVNSFGISWTTLELLILIFGLVIVSYIDLDTFLLPDKFTLPGIVIGLLGAALNPERTFGDSFLGVLLGGGFLWAIAYLYFLFRKEEGMGGGDIKLLAWIGAVLGWKAIPFVILSSSVIGSVVGLVFAIRSAKGMKTVIPFGPYLALGALLYIFGGKTLGLWYISLFLPALS